MTQQRIIRFDTNALHKVLLGFDPLFNNFEHRFANQIQQNYPPYNVLKHNDNFYEIEVAVTGFDPDEIVVEIDQNHLIVKGQRKREEDPNVQYEHRSLATRDFTRAWLLPEHMEVSEGKIKNGILNIELKRVVPEALKPRVLKITAE